MMCECRAFKGIYRVRYEPGTCEAVVKCDECGQLWYAILFERMNIEESDTLEEYQIPITEDEFQIIKVTQYEDLRLNFLAGRTGRMLHGGGTFPIDARAALERCGKS